MIYYSVYIVTVWGMWLIVLPLILHAHVYLALVALAL